MATLIRGYDKRRREYELYEWHFEDDDHLHIEHIEEDS